MASCAIAYPHLDRTSYS